MSQRALAARTGLSASAVAAYESGSRSPTVQVLQEVLALAGLELGLTAPLPAPDGALLDHLRLGLTPRLNIALGGSGNVRHDPPARWTQLWELARYGRVGLVGPAAVGVWVVPVPAPARVTVAFGDERTLVVAPEVAAVAVDLDVVAAGLGPLPSVPVMHRGQRAFVEPPAELAVDPTCAQWQTSLTVAARALHTDRTADEAGRRAPAHRDPRHAMEAYRVFHTKRYGQRLMPADAQLRSWRLDGPVGFAQWLGWIGYPA